MRYLKCLILIFTAFSTFAVADVPRTPSLDIDLIQPAKGLKLSVTSATLWGSDKPDKGFKELDANAWHTKIRVGETRISIIAFTGFSRYLKISVTFSDGKVRQSNVFQVNGLNSNLFMEVIGQTIRIESRARLLDKNDGQGRSPADSSK